MFIKTLRKDVFDVFLGKGWDNAVRVQRTKEGTIIIVLATCDVPANLTSVLKNKLH